MPFNINNVDISVNANVIFGLNNLLLTLNQTQREKLFTQELKQMYINATSMIAWSIENDIISWRPDLALLYYPSIYDFYWFASRNLQLLESNQ
jgi:hypothetical protein